MQAEKVGDLWGYKTLPNWLKKKYLEASPTCQLCKNKSSEIHRIKRGHKGGLYTLSKLNHPQCNVMVLCSEHHKKIHENELGCGSHSYL